MKYLDIVAVSARSVAQDKMKDRDIIAYNPIKDMTKNTGHGVLFFAEIPARAEKRTGLPAQWRTLTRASSNVDYCSYLRIKPPVAPAHPCEASVKCVSIISVSFRNISVVQFWPPSVVLNIWPASVR